MERFVGLIGLTLCVGIAFALSSHRKKVDLRLVGMGLVLQLVLALLVLGVPSLGFDGPLHFIFAASNTAISALLAFTTEGSKFVFGNLAEESTGFFFAFQVLPTIIFMASLMSLLYHLGVMQKLVKVLAVVMQKLMGTSGAESLAMAANIFFGQTEAPLVVRPYVSRMTQSELFTLMVGGMATVAGGVLAAYVKLLGDHIPNIGGHLLTASVLSAPAALIIAKIMLPEVANPETLGRIPDDSGARPDHNVIEAAARGAGDGLKLALNVAAMLLAFIALIAMADAVLKEIGEWINFSSWGASYVPELIRQDGRAELSFSLILGWIFSPLAWSLGIPWSEATTAGALLGEKIMLNEFFAYLHLAQIGEQLSTRTMIILSYALCGFANFSSIAIQIGGIGGIAPNRRTDLAKLGIRSIVGGSLAAFMTAAIAGILL